MRHDPLHAVPHDRPATPLDPVAAASALDRPSGTDAVALADETRVERRGTDRTRATLLAAGLLGAGALGSTILPWPATVAGCIALGIPFYRWLIPYREELRLAEEGIERRVSYGRGSHPWITRIAWTDIVEYQSGGAGGAADLGVESSRGVRITFHEDRASDAARALIARFVERAEHHERVVRDTATFVERAERLGVAVHDPSEPRGFQGMPPQRMLAMIGIVIAGSIVGELARRGRRLTYVDSLLGLAAYFVVLGTLNLWLALGDSDVAWTDRAASTRMARMRNRLRRLFRIRLV